MPENHLKFPKNAHLKPAQYPAERIRDPTHVDQLIFFQHNDLQPLFSPNFIFSVAQPKTCPEYIINGKTTNIE